MMEMSPEYAAVRARLHSKGPGALDELKRLAKDGDAHAQMALADMYISGKGIGRDRARGFKLITKAAAQGLGEAQLAHIYFTAKGIGRPANPVLARNMLAMFRRDYRLVAELHVMSGWVPPGTSIGAFEAAIRTVCEPLFEKPIKDIAFGDALVKLFQTARRFDMPVQPQLVLLQKTLVNIEGLGRQLYPDLDLWSTAKPFLEKWVKKRFNPITIGRDLGRQAPEMVEKLPEIPQLIWQSIDGVRQIAAAAPALEAAAAQLSQQAAARPRQQKRRGIALAAIAIGLWRGLPATRELPLDAVVLVGLGLLALWLS